MKTKNLLSLFLALTSILYSNLNNANTLTPSHLSTISIKHFFQTQAVYRAPNNPWEQIAAPSKVKTNTFNESLSNYVKEMYNNRYYSDFLSQNGAHVVEFLELSNELNLGIESLYTSLRLLYNKIKECELVDDTVVIQILEPLPELLEKYFEEEKEEKGETITLDFLIKNTEKLLLYKFTEHLEEFQTEPDTFVTQLSEEIALMAKQEIEAIEKKEEKKEMIERLRQLVIRFFETSLNKLIWNQAAYEGIWESVLKIANGLQLLGVHGILEHMDDLDDLQWSLTHRFCYFLEIAGSSLPLSFYEEVENDLESKVAFFLEMQEQDEGIRSKKEILWKALMRAKAKALAFEKNGLFTDQMI